MQRLGFLFVTLLGISALSTQAEVKSQHNPLLPGVHVLALLPPGPGNPRNSEGSFIRLKDGRILFAYSKFLGSVGSDDAPAMIAGRYSSDGGRSWAAVDTPIVERSGSMNVMSVSLLRLQDGRIALFYVRKDSISDAHIYVRYSSDETRTWSAPTLCIHDRGYYVLNNDRVIQLHTGRLVVPVALQSSVDGRFDSRGQAMTYLSDDAGATWHRSHDILVCPTPSRAGFQEPGVVELRDGRVMMFIRTALGSQYISYSKDGGEHWSTAQPSSIQSPLSPASIKRIPSTGDLLLVWNDHSKINPLFRASEHSFGKRTPLSVAVSKDDGRTWIHVHDILEDPNGCYCYVAIAFVNNRILLGFSSTGKGLACLSQIELIDFPIRSIEKN